MSGDAMKVDFNAMSAHEGEVRDTGDQVQAAVDAAGTAQALGTDAFGIVGQLIAIPIQEWLTVADTFLVLTAKAGHEVADRLNAANKLFTEHEADAKCTIEAAGRGPQA